MRLEFLSEQVWCLNQQVGTLASWVHEDQPGAWVFRVGLKRMLTGVSLLIQSMVMDLDPNLCIWI